MLLATKKQTLKIDLDRMNRSFFEHNTTISFDAVDTRLPGETRLFLEYSVGI